MIVGGKKNFISTLDAAIADLKNGYTFNDIHVLRQSIRTAISEGLVDGDYLDKAPLPYGVANEPLSGYFASTEYTKFGFAQIDGDLSTLDYIRFSHDAAAVKNNNIIDTVGAKYDAFQLAKARYFASPFYSESVAHPAITTLPVPAVQATHVIPLPASTIGLLYSPTTNPQAGAVVSDTSQPGNHSVSGSLQLGAATLTLAPTSCAAMGGEPWMVMVGAAVICSIMAANRIRHAW